MKKYGIDDGEEDRVVVVQKDVQRDLKILWS